FQLNNRALSGIEIFEPIERFVEGEKIVVIARGWEFRIVDRDAAGTPATFGILSRPRGIYENAPHQPGSHGEKMSAILPGNIVVLDQPDVGFVHKSRGLQCVIASFLTHMPLCDPPEFTLDQRHQTS